MNPIIISFFTNDWQYPKHAERLKKECYDLKLENYIISIPSLNNYRQNCNIKPKFILESLLKFKQPVLWLDVDSTVLKIPEEMINNAEYDIIGVSKENPELIYVNCLYFHHTDNSKKFLENWKIESDNFIDDGAFQITFKKLPNTKILKLRTCYNQTQFRSNTPITEEAHFINRLSSSDLKISYKNKVEKR